jgi:hypothetical protein
MAHLRNIYSLLLVLLLGAAPCVAVVREVNAKSAHGSMHPKEVAEDRFMVYDFHDEHAERSNVDNPIGLIFTGNASVNKIKDVFDYYFREDLVHGVPSGFLGDLGKSPQYAHLYPGTIVDGVRGGSWQWDKDTGEKTILCGKDRNGTFAEHMRIYAPTWMADGRVDSMYNTVFGYYVIASAHQDHNECPFSGTKWFGYSEYVENKVTSIAKVTKGIGKVLPDRIWLANREGYQRSSSGSWVPAPYKEGDYVWLNNGWATRIETAIPISYISGGGSPEPPTVTTGGVSNIQPTSATLNGTINPSGYPTTYRFEYGTTTSYGQNAPVPNGSAGDEDVVDRAVTVNNLAPGSTYHYRLVATNEGGTTYGTDKTFKTVEGSFNGDNKDDLIVANGSTVNSYSVALSTGAYLDAPGTQNWLTGWEGDPVWGDVGDFNADGKTDLVIGSAANNAFTVALSDGTKLGASPSGIWRPGWGYNPPWGGVGDFNGDGKDDVIFAGGAANTYAVAISTGVYFDGPGTQIWLSGWNGNPPWGGVGDFNGDGKDDIVIGSAAQNGFVVALSDGTKLNGAGTWRSGWGYDPIWGGVGDFNGDGKDDLIFSTGSTNSYAVALSTGTSFDAPGTQLWLTGWEGNPPFADVGDFNGDGKDDLIIGSAVNNAYTVALSDGTKLNVSGSGIWRPGWGYNPPWGAAG